MTGARDPRLEAALDRTGLSDEARARILTAETETTESTPVIISRLGLLPDTEMVAALAEEFGLSVADEAALPEAVIAPDLSPAFLRARRLLPLSETDTVITVGIVDPSRRDALPGIAFVTGKRVTGQIIGFGSWRRAFERLYPQAAEVDGGGSGRRGARWTDDAAGLKDLALDAPAVRTIERLIGEAIDLRSSDIHIERSADGGLVRFRVDGRLRLHERLAPALAERAVARLKVLGDLDVSDHRRAQDGRTTLTARGTPVDVRLSIIPSAWGEGAVIRLLHRSDVRLDFAELGFSQPEISRLRDAIARPQGFFLVSGPTGAGKTTTLYAALNALRSPDRKIVTVEDPIEYFFEGVHQTAIDDKAGLGFAAALRAFLRHDPDIVLVGEIRDAETAKTAVQAALTGHMVLSTIHANDAASVPARLVEMGVEPYLVAATLTATSAQRLVRRLCHDCRAEIAPPTDLIARARITLPGDAQFYEASGCEHCEGGYRGRLVLSESLPFNDQVRALVRDSASPADFRGFVPVSLLADGIMKAAAGDTSVSEVLRALEAV